SSVPVLDRQMLLEIPHWSLFILGLNALISKKPHSFEKATAPVDAKNWISHMEKIFDVMGCEDAFKTRLAVYKFEGNALAWWKAYKQAKGGDAWLITDGVVGFKIQEGVPVLDPLIHPITLQE
nr:zinc finger, CCHC-type, retrotransposon Gag domain protein [Tanacetum cinerariifolium]